MKKTSARRMNAASLRFRKVLVVRKKTYLTQVREQNDERMLALIAEGHASVAKVVRSHEENEATIAAILRELDRHGIEYKVVHRESMEEELLSGQYGLVITAGGDGTVLDVSHYLGDDIYVLGVNSALSSSHGHWCTANVHNIAAVLADVVEGRLQPLRIMRLTLTLDGQVLPQLVLNEVLVAHSVIGDTSRYLVNIGRHTEEHKSDGLFVGTAGGSTGWMRSYGAELMPITSRQTQFLTRGLIVPPGTQYRLVRGMLTRKRIAVTSQMPEGKLMIDGRHIAYDFPRGAELTISPAKQDLRLFIDRAVNERYYGAQAERKTA